jgi:hypothetical protein
MITQPGHLLLALKAAPKPPPRRQGRAAEQAAAPLLSPIEQPAAPPQPLALRRASSTHPTPSTALLRLATDIDRSREGPPTAAGDACAAGWLLPLSQAPGLQHTAAALQSRRRLTRRPARCNGCSSWRMGCQPCKVGHAGLPGAACGRPWPCQQRSCSSTGVANTSRCPSQSKSRIPQTGAAVLTTFACYLAKRATAMRSMAAVLKLPYAEEPRPGAS